MRWKELIFDKLRKYSILRALDKSLKLTDEDLQKYMEFWESKMPEPIYGGYSGFQMTPGSMNFGFGQLASALGSTTAAAYPMYSYQ
jgi:hypothetical protein